MARRTLARFLVAGLLAATLAESALAQQPAYPAPRSPSPALLRIDPFEGFLLGRIAENVDVTVNVAQAVGPCVERAWTWITTGQDPALPAAPMPRAKPVQHELRFQFKLEPLGSSPPLSKEVFQFYFGLTVPGEPQVKTAITEPQVVGCQALRIRLPECPSVVPAAPIIQPLGCLIPVRLEPTKQLPQVACPAPTQKLECRVVATSATAPRSAPAQVQAPVMYTLQAASPIAATRGFNGTWYREMPGMVSAVTFKGDEMKVTLAGSDGGMEIVLTVTADCAVAKDGTVHGVVTGVDVNVSDLNGPNGMELAGLALELQSVVDQPFAFRCRATDDGLMVSNVRLAFKGRDTEDAVAGMGSMLSGLYKSCGSNKPPKPTAGKGVIINVYSSDPNVRMQQMQQVLTPPTACPQALPLPSGQYLQHHPQYFPPDAAFPLPREWAQQEDPDGITRQRIGVDFNQLTPNGPPMRIGVGQFPQPVPRYVAYTPCQAVPPTVCPGPVCQPPPCPPSAAPRYLINGSPVPLDWADGSWIPPPPPPITAGWNPNCQPQQVRLLVPGGRYLPYAPSPNAPVMACPTPVQSSVYAPPTMPQATVPPALPPLSDAVYPERYNTTARQAVTAPPPQVANGTNAPRTVSIKDVVELAQIGVGDDVIVNQIRNTNSKYALTVADIKYLKMCGVSDQVIVEMQGSSQPQVYYPPIVSTGGR